MKRSKGFECKIFHDHDFDLVCSKIPRFCFQGWLVVIAVLSP